MKTYVLVLALVVAPISAAKAAIIYDPGAGTGAPPEVLGDRYMWPVVDPSPVFSTVTSIPGPLGGALTFSTPMSHRKIGSGWSTWSHGYTGDVYYTNGATSVTVTMPLGALGFGFHIQPNPFSLETFEAVADDGTSSGEFTAHGSSGATYVGFYTTGATSLASVEITGSTDFAIGELAIGGFPEPASVGLVALGGLVVLRRRR